jgi:hypothetical protein
MIFEMLRWWYVTGWLQAAHRIGSWTVSVEHMFSLSLLLRTLFAPWRRIMTPKGRGLDAHLHAAVDNLVSRCVGFVIRLGVLLAAAVAMLIAVVMSVVMVVVWPVLPLLFIELVVKGVTG